MVALAPAYPPDSGEPRSGAPLDSVITVLPGASGASSASRVQWKACATSTSQLRLNVCHVWCWTGRGSGVAPALSTSTPGRYLSISSPAAMGSAASADTAVNDPPSSERRSSSAARSRATPTTCAPARLRAVAMPRPKPRLAPVTSAVAPAISCLDITILQGLVKRRPPPGRPADIDQPGTRESPRAGAQRTRELGWYHAVACGRTFLLVIYACAMPVHYRGRWLCLILLGVGVGWGAGNIGPVVGPLTEQFGVSLGAVGLLSGTVYFAAVLVATPLVVPLAARVGVVRAAAAAAVVMAAGHVVFALSPVFAGLLAARVVVGAGAGLALVAGPVLARELGGVRLLGLLGGAITLGIATALGLGSVLQDAGVDWRIGFAVSAAICASPLLA